MPLEAVVGAIDRDRLAATTYELVKVPSPSGDEGAIAELYAEMLADAGLDVQLDRAFPESPSVIGRTATPPVGQILQLAGHLDTVSSAHDEPVNDGSVIRGRGAADMKSGLAVIVETVRAARSAGCLDELDLLVTAYGQHEETINHNGLHAPLIDLLARGIHGSACIVTEGPHDFLPLAGRGSIIFEITFEGPPTSTHEVLGQWPADRNPVMAAVEFVNALSARASEWTLVDNIAGGESFFIGRLAGGDLYNRVPVRAVCEGTRRYPPGRSFAEARDELLDLAQQAASRVEVSVRPRIVKTGQPFRLADDEPLVNALSRGHARVTGRTLDLGVIPYSADGSQIIEYAGIPAVYHGTNSTTAHADNEWIAIDDIERCAQVVVATMLGYFELAVAPGERTE